MILSAHLTRGALLSLLCGVLLLSAVSCQTAGNAGRPYVRNGEAYGTTEGRFRGRWWNYYERGRSFSDGAFWQEAERDFRTALASRARDQLWARTYGLHFLPEYFPHRELGAVLFHQGLLDEAAAELLESHRQQPSARAAYFLERVRRAQLAQGPADEEAPVFEIAPAAWPIDYEQRVVRISGSVRDKGYLQSLRINEETVDLGGPWADASFERELPAHNQQMRIVFEAVDLSGNVRRQTVDLAPDLQGPVLQLTPPVTLPGVVRGMAFDPAGTVELSIAGCAATLGKRHGVATAFEVAVDRDALGSLDRPPVYESKDGLGNMARGVLPADAAVFSSNVPRVVPTALHTYGRTDGMVLRAQAMGENVLVSAVPTREGPLSVRLTNMMEGLRIPAPHVWVSAQIDAVGELAFVRINGQDATLYGKGEAAYQRLLVAARVPIEPGANRIEVRARLADGHEVIEETQVERVPQAFEQDASRLGVVFTQGLWWGNPAGPGSLDALALALEEKTAILGRFRVLDRTLLPTVLNEQLLTAALGQREARLQVASVLPAEAFLIPRIHQDADSLELVVHAVSSDTGEILARLDAAGPADTSAALDDLAVSVAGRLMQAFPRTGAPVLSVRSGGRSVFRHAPSLWVDGESWTLEGALPEQERHAPLRAFLDALEQALLNGGQVRLISGKTSASRQREALLEDGDLAAADQALTAPALQGRLIVGKTWTVQAELHLPAGAPIPIEVSRSMSSPPVSAEVSALAGAVGQAVAQRLPAETPIEQTGPTLRVDTGLAKRDGVRPGMRCTLYRQREVVLNPLTQEPLGHEYEVLGMALLTRVAAGHSEAITFEGQPLEEPPRSGDRLVVR